MLIFFTVLLVGLYVFLVIKDKKNQNNTPEVNNIWELERIQRNQTDCLDAPILTVRICKK